MTASSPCHDYYKQMLELQEKLRKSEQERLELEKRFDVMQRESQLRHEASINKLRMRYIEFLEEQRMREQRNYELLKALDRIDDSLMLMTAKADRLHTFRKEYDASVKRASVNQFHTGSAAIDSGIISQNEERKSRMGLHALSHYMPKSRFDVERSLYTPTSQSTPQNLNHIPNNPTKVFDRLSSLLHSSKPFDDHDLLSQYRQSHLGKAQDIESTTWAAGNVSNDLDPILKSTAHENTTERLLSPQHPKYRMSLPNKSNLTSVIGTLLPSKEEYVGSVLENELDRYIHKIRILHDHSDSHSLEEVEQNTSRDLLNVTLSDDSLHHLPVEEKIQKPEMDVGVGRILSIADDLVSKIMEKEDCMNHVEPQQITEESTQAVNIGKNSMSAPEADRCAPAMNVNASISDMQAATSTLAPGRDIGNASINNVLIHTSKSPRTEANIEATTAPASVEKFPQVQYAQPQRADFDSPDNHINAQNIEHHEETINSIELHDQPQAVTNENHETVTSMETCKTDDLVARVPPSTTSTNDAIHSIDASPHHKSDAPSHCTSDNVSAEMMQDEMDRGNAVDSIYTGAIPNANIIPNHENDLNEDQTVVAAYEVPADDDENPQEQQFEQLYTQNAEDYPHDPNQMYEYSGEQYHDPNQQYQYDPNLQYQQSTDEEYHYDQQNLQYIEDPNAQYQNQPYINDNNQQYAMNPDQQYQGYDNGPHNQYESEAHIQHSDATYDPNTHYTYPTDNQNYAQENDYDASQGFVHDQHHQEYQGELEHYDPQDIDGKATTDDRVEDSSNNTNENVGSEEHRNVDSVESNALPVNHQTTKTSISALENVQDSETDSIIEKNISNTESDFDFN